MKLYTTNAGPVREDTYQGRLHYVAPVVAIVAGVLNGELVVAEEIADGYLSWNGRPITLDHPQTSDGTHIPANSPAVLETFCVGSLFHVAFEEDRLKGEIWVDAELAANKTEGPQLVTALKSGTRIEVSTAYYRQTEQKEGTYENVAYNAIAHDIKPDHLAILLHKDGACSWEDGCGVPRTNQEDRTMSGNEKSAAQHSWWERFKRMFAVPTINQEGESLEEKWEKVVGAFYALIDSGQAVGEVAEGYIVAVFEDKLIVERPDRLLFAIDYNEVDGKIEFGESTQVKMVYEPVTGDEDPASNEDNPGKPEGEEEEEEEESEEDSEEEEEAAEEDEEEEPEPDAEEEEEQEEEDDPAPAANETPTLCEKAQSLLEFAEANGGVEQALSILEASVQREHKKRNGLIQNLIGRNELFTAEELADFETDVLEKMVAISKAPPTPNYSGVPEGVSEGNTEERVYDLPPMRG